MDYFVALLVAACAAGIAYATLNKEIATKISVLRPTDTLEMFESKEMGQQHIFLLTAFVAVVSVPTTLKLLNTVSNMIGIVKMLLSLFCMIGAAAVDYREHRIPNLFPAVMSAGGIVLLIAGLISKQSGAVDYITTNVITAMCCAAILLFASILTKQGIGAGDIKLICSLALIAGIYTVIGTLFFGVVLCSITAIIALLTKRKNFSDSFPFGPFLYLGYVITVISGAF